MFSIKPAIATLCIAALTVTVPAFSAELLGPGVISTGLQETSATLGAGMAHARTTPPVAPRLFAPGVISAADYDASPAFTPGGNTVFFSRATLASSVIMMSHREGPGWSAPLVAKFSRRWSNFEPTMAPNGSFMVFASNRPVTADGKAIDGFFNGKHWPGNGGNLWRVDQRGDNWGTPRRLPATINRNTSTFSPSVAADGSLYFMQADPAGGNFHIWRSALLSGVYQTPVRMKLGGTDTEEVDPAVAPGQLFIVFSLRHPARKDHNRLQIAFRDGDGWGKPIDLGDTVNDNGSNIEARLGSDGRTLYFGSGRRVNQDARDGGKSNWNNGKTNIWYVPLAPWLDTPGSK